MRKIREKYFKQFKFLNYKLTILTKNICQADKNRTYLKHQSLLSPEE